MPLPSRQCSFLRRTLFVPFTPNHSANTSWCHCRLGSAPSYDVPCSFPSRRTVPRTPLGATAVSAVLFLTTYLARSLHADPFREHPNPSYDVPRTPLGATAVSAVLLLTTYLVRSLWCASRTVPSANTSWCHCRLGSAPSYAYLARSLFAEPFREHLPVPLPSRQCSLRRSFPFTPSAHLLVPLPSRQCSFLRRTLLVPFSLTYLACLHSASPEGTYLNQPGVEPMRAVRATRNPGFTSIQSPQAQRAGPGRSSHPTTQFARLDLRSPTPCVLVLEIEIVFVVPSVPSVSSCSFASSSSCWRQSTLNSEEENHEIHETHERLAKTMIPVCRWDVYGFRPSFYRLRRVFAEGDQHPMVTRPHGNVTSPTHFPVWFAACRRRTDPLACASSLYALARPPYKHAARASGSDVSVLAVPRRSRLGVRELVTAFWYAAACEHPQFARPDLPTPICDLRHMCPRARNRNRLCSSLCSLRFLLFIRIFVFVLASIVTQLRRQEPRKTRITRKAERISNRSPQRDRCLCCPARTTCFPFPMSED